ncbi:hypothetical protein PENTCL1PPCAC_6298, partial [Pristionchus entomophagus]
ADRSILPSPCSVEHVNVVGSVYCDAGKGKGITLLQDMTIQLMEHDAWPQRDSHLNTTKTNKQGGFSISGSSDELWNNHFYVEIYVPCGDTRIEKCDQWASMCPSNKPECQYYVWLWVPKEKNYCPGEEKVRTLLLHDFNVWKYGKENKGYEYCP